VTTPVVTDPFLTLADAAAVLNCSDESIRRAVKRGDLAAFKDGRVVRIPQSALDDYVARHTTRPDQLTRRRQRRTSA
jgi:excisionase family DNA binding protein